MTMSNTAKIRIFLLEEMATGWVAFDDVELYQIAGGNRTGSNLASQPGFESATGWTTGTYYPSTSFYRSTWGTAAPHTGSYAYVISNQAYGYLQSDLIPASPNSPYSLYVYLRGELDADDSEGAWSIRAYFYDNSQQYLSYAETAAGAPGSLDTTWRQLHHAGQHGFYPDLLVQLHEFRLGGFR